MKDAYVSGETTCRYLERACQTGRAFLSNVLSGGTSKVFPVRLEVDYVVFTSSWRGDRRTIGFKGSGVTGKR